MTCDMLAEQIGASRYSIMRYESGETEPPLRDLTKMAALFGIEVDMLYDDYYDFLAYPYSQKIKECRQQRKLTQRELGAMVGVAAGTVKRWESGRHNVTREMWKELKRLKLM